MKLHPENINSEGHAGDLKKIPKRVEVDPKKTWNLQKLFSSFADWQNAFDALPREEDLLHHISESYLGKLGSSPQLIADVLDEKHELRRKLLNLYVYAGLRNAEDVGESTSTQAQAKIHAKYASLAALYAFVEPELLRIETLQEWTRTDSLKKYAFDIHELLREKMHVLSEPEEKLLANLSPIFSQFSTIHTKWNNVDLKFADAIDSKGNSHKVTHGRYGNLLSNPDRELRKSAFESVNGECAKQRNTIASNFYARLLTGSLVAKARNYQGFRHSQLSADAIPELVYDNLIESVRKNLDALHQSLALRAKVLNTDFVFPYDRRVSLAKQESEVRFTFEEACELVLAAVAPLGEEYVQIARNGLLVERWADWCENEGKRSGAFSWGTYDSNPVIHITWTGTLDDVFTLAHELGHSMHSYFSNHSQPYHLASYTIFVAEVASTLNEALLAKHILRTQSNTILGKAVLSQLLEGFEGTVLRQVLFAAFESTAAAQIDAGNPLAADDFEEIFLKLNQEWYGEKGGISPFSRYEWMRIPHFYSTFYVYKYATSYCAAQALQVQLLDPNPTTSAAARTRIFALLRAGGSKQPLEILRAAGVDLATANPIDNAFKTYRENINLGNALFL